jgi:hypothetical protein
MPERRQAERAPCRLRCRIERGREQIQSRIVDVSEGGLCLISPVWLKPNQEFEISIDVPGTGVAKVRVELWHIRRETSQRTKSRVWIAGAILVDADEAYTKLLKAAGVAQAKNNGSAETSPNGPKRAAATKVHDPIDTFEPNVYRIRCKAIGGPRSRVLSLAADSEEQARALATRDLGEAWTVLEVRKA